MNNNVVLSICIPTYNRSESVYECVTQILDNYHYDDIEVIVSDNCSTDETKEKLSVIQDKRFKYYRNDENTKFINLFIAMSYASGQYSMLLSDEDSINIELLHDLLQYLDKKTRFAIIKSDIYNEMEGTKQHFRCNVSSYYDKIMAVLNWGYLSGNIYNNRLILPILRKLNFNNYERYWKTIGEYPHVWLALMICHRGEIFFLEKVLIIQTRESKSDNVLDKAKVHEFTWSIDRRFEQEIAICKSFKHLQLSKLSAKEKVKLYCSRVWWLMALTGSIYYQTLYGDNYEYVLKTYHPEDVESLNYWRNQPRYIEKNIYLSYRIVNRSIINSLWKNKWDFMKDCFKNWQLIKRLYIDTINEYKKTRDYLRMIDKS